jgi:hypothetical protein
VPILPDVSNRATTISRGATGLDLSRCRSSRACHRASQRRVRGARRPSTEGPEAIHLRARRPRSSLPGSAVGRSGRARSASWCRSAHHGSCLLDAARSQAVAAHKQSGSHQMRQGRWGRTQRRARAHRPAAARASMARRRQARWAEARCAGVDLVPRWPGIRARRAARGSAGGVGSQEPGAVERIADARACAAATLTSPA